MGHYRVFTNEEGEYKGIFSENTEIIEGFNKLSSQTSPETPAKIVVGDYEDIYAVTTVGNFSLLDDPEGRKTEFIPNGTAQCMNEASIIPVNAKEPIDCSMPYSTRGALDCSKYLNIGWIETQGEEPWCAAYATASICRYIKGDSAIRARKVMQHAYPNTSDAALKKKSLSHAQAVAYGKSKGLAPKDVGLLGGQTIM